MSGFGDSRTLQGTDGVLRGSSGFRLVELRPEALRLTTNQTEFVEHLFALGMLANAPLALSSYASATRARILKWIRRERLLMTSAGIGAALVPAPLPYARETLTGWSLSGRSRALVSDSVGVLIVAAREESGTIGLFVLNLPDAYELEIAPSATPRTLDFRGVRVSPYDRVGSFDSEGVRRLARLAGSLRREIERMLA